MQINGRKTESREIDNYYARKCESQEISTAGNGFGTYAVTVSSLDRASQDVRTCDTFRDVANIFDD